MNSRHGMFSEKEFIYLVEKYPNLQCVYCNQSINHHTVDVWNNCYELLKKEYEVNSKINSQVVSLLQTFGDTLDVIQALYIEESKRQNTKGVS